MKTFITDTLPGRTVTLQDGKEFLWFSGTDYLGMGHNEALRSHIVSGLTVYGTHYGSSRNNSLQLSIYDEAEKQLADFAMAPASLTLSSGMWAGQLVMREIETITQKSGTSDCRYHYAPGTHTAIRGHQYIATAITWHEWALKTVSDINESIYSTVHIIVSDSIGSPWVEQFDFSLFEALKHPNVWLVIDDSHGLGITGKDGQGIYQILKKCVSHQIIVTASLNKGMGIQAGAIFAEKGIVQHLKTSQWFSSASPALPAYMYALKVILEAKGYEAPYHRLMANILYLQNRITDCTYITQISGYPVLCSRHPQLFDYFLSNHILASKFPYPSATDEPVTRIAVSALHQKEDLDQLAEVLVDFQTKFIS